MKIITEDGREFEVTPGTIKGRIYEPEWFPTRHADLFEVGFHTAGPPMFHDVPEIGDRIAADFQQNGPFGEVWYSSKIKEIIYGSTSS